MSTLRLTRLCLFILLGLGTLTSGESHACAGTVAAIGSDIYKQTTEQTFGLLSYLQQKVSELETKHGTAVPTVSTGGDLTLVSYSQDQFPFLAATLGQDSSGSRSFREEVLAALDPERLKNTYKILPEPGYSNCSGAPELAGDILRLNAALKAMVACLLKPELPIDSFTGNYLKIARMVSHFSKLPALVKEFEAEQFAKGFIPAAFTTDGLQNPHGEKFESYFPGRPFSALVEIVGWGEDDEEEKAQKVFWQTAEKLGHTIFSEGEHRFIKIDALVEKKLGQVGLLYTGGLPVPISGSDSWNYFWAAESERGVYTFTGSFGVGRQISSNARLKIVRFFLQRKQTAAGTPGP